MNEGLLRWLVAGVVLPLLLTAALTITGQPGALFTGEVQSGHAIVQDDWGPQDGG